MSAAASEGGIHVAASLSPRSQHSTSSIFSPSSHASPLPIKATKSIIGPGRISYTPGEAAKLGLTIRTACESCRSRKLKCSGTPPEKEGCQRCKTDAIDCIYTARAPIGRPKKRKADEGDSLTREIKADPNATATKAKLKRTTKASIKVHHDRESMSPPKSYLAQNRRSADETSTKGSTFEELISAAAAVHTQGSSINDVLGVSSSATFPANVFSSSLTSNAQVPSQLSSYVSSPMDSIGSSTAGGYPTTPPLSDHSQRFHHSRFHSEDQPRTGSSSSLFRKAMRSPSDAFRQRQSNISTSSAAESLTSPISIVGHMSHFNTSTAFSSLLTSEFSHNPSPPSGAPYGPAPDAGLYAAMSTSAGRAPVRSSSSNVPSLDDLSIAAFLQSLDTLEIAPSELIQQECLQSTASKTEEAMVKSESNAWTPSGDSGLSLASAQPACPSLGACQAFSSERGAELSAENFAATFEQWTSSSAILQDGLSFAVPADFSWWDLGLDQGSSSGMVTPATEQPLFTGSMPNKPSWQPLSKVATTRREEKKGKMSDSPGKSQNWPRGAENGMGKGQIHTTNVVGLTGFGWSSLPSNSPNSNPAAADSSQQQQLSQPSPTKPSCCSGKDAEAAAPKVEEVPAASCCSRGKGKETAATLIKQEEGLSNELPAKSSCCSKKSKAAAEPVPSGLSPSSAVNIAEGSGSSQAGSSPVHHPSKVHCVPNPSGKGCTCLCDMSVALLSVKRTLRETSRVSEGAETTDDALTKKDGEKAAANATIQLTLSASQAIAAQCACSADCPTCRSDPSTEISASLLVSTALQIYARAVRTLREGFAAGGVVVGGLDVRIGNYKPAASNARRIALFAMKLELRDLSVALGKISKMTHKRRSPGEEAAVAQPSTKSSGWMNPIDQLVIKKLHQQLGELLNTIQSMESQSQLQPQQHRH